MNLRNLGQALLAAVLLIASTSVAQQRITLEDIWKDGTFRAQYPDQLRSLDNGQEYVLQNYDRAARTVSIDVYDYATGNKKSTLLSSADLPNLDYFQSFQFSDDERKLILTAKSTPIFRRSSRGIYHVYDRDTGKLTRLDKDEVMEPTFSPDGTKVAFVKNNNIYYRDLIKGATLQITKDGVQNEIINGIADWVYEEEFSTVRSFDWNAAGDRIAYIKYDERNVPEFSMDMYGQDLYQYPYVFKYPKAGEKNSEVSLHIHDLGTSVTTNIDFGRDDFYIPRINWTPDADKLAVRIMNREQNEIVMHVLAGKNNYRLNPVYTERDAAYIDVTDDLYFLEDGSFIWTSEKDNRNHVYHMSATGKLIKQITKGDWDVTNLYGVDEQGKKLYYQSTENGSINRDVYSIGLDGKNKKRLSTQEGSNSANFTSNYSLYVLAHSSATQPTTWTLHETNTGKMLRTVQDNEALKKKASRYMLSQKEFSTIKVNGNDLNMYMIKPMNFDESKTYGLLMHQYSGPGSQQVANRWNGANDYWHQMLANDLDIIIAVVDGRGTGYKGADFKKVTQNELGKYELEDQIAAAEKLKLKPYIDGDRIGIWGWSYGGFMSSNAIFQAPDTFSLAIAVAPVTSWRFYDTIYTERYMNTPQNNASGYDNNSPISHVDGLKGDYLLVHGSADDNVHVQNTMRLIEALVQANKKFDWRIYPDKNHGIYGGNTRLHLYGMMTDFLKEKL